MENEVKEEKSDCLSSSSESKVFTRWLYLCKRLEEEENTKTTSSSDNGIDEENIQKGLNTRDKEKHIRVKKEYW